MLLAVIDLTDVLVNVGKVIPPALMLLQGIFAVIGLYLGAGALMEMYGSADGNAHKFVAGKDTYSFGSALAQLVVAAFFLGLADMQLVGILSRTLTTDYANSRMVSYSASGSTLAEQSQLAVLALLGIMQVVGFVSMAKGLITVNHHFNGRRHEGLGTATAWILGGLLAWNFKWFSDVLNNTLGFDFFNLFSLASP